MSENNIPAIRDLLYRAGAAHGVYETNELNGVYDQDWHLWYASWALEHGLNDLLPQPTDAAALAARLFDLNEQHKQTDKRLNWEEFTAEKLAAEGD